MRNVGHYVVPVNSHHLKSKLIEEMRLKYTASGLFTQVLCLEHVAVITS